MKLKSGLVAFMLNGQEMGRTSSTDLSAHMRGLITITNKQTKVHTMISPTHKLNIPH